MNKVQKSTDQLKNSRVISYFEIASHISNIHVNVNDNLFIQNEKHHKYILSDGCFNQIKMTTKRSNFIYHLIVNSFIYIGPVCS